MRGARSHPMGNEHGQDDRGTFCLVNGLPLTVNGERVDE